MAKGRRRLALVVSIATGERKGVAFAFSVKNAEISNLSKLHRLKIPAGVITCILVDHSGKNKGPIVGNKKDRPNRLRENE